MAKQDTLIGTHPTAPNLFGRWLASLNHPESPTQCHRSLTDMKTLDEGELLDWLSNEVIKHHYKEDQLARLKAKYTSLGFTEYAEQQRMIPTSDKVKKGNLTEVILFEYIVHSTNKPLLKTYRFRYSPNVDQSMKGDDVLMVDFNEETDNVQIYLGEAKFRQTPTKTVVDDISKSLSKDTKPLSFTFLVERLLESDLTQAIGLKLDDVIIDTVKRNGNITYTGLLLSNERSSNCVQTNLNSDNLNLIFLSLSVENPTLFMTKIFECVEQKLNNPTKL